MNPSTSTSSTTAPSRDSINLRTLRRSDPQITSILASASHATLYTWQKEGGDAINGGNGKWRKEGVEGSLFVYSRSTTPTSGYLILNRHGIHNFSRFVTPRTVVQIEDQLIQIDHHDDASVQDEDGMGELVGLWVHGGISEAERVKKAMDLRATSQSLPPPRGGDQQPSNVPLDAAAAVSTRTQQQPPPPPPQPPSRQPNGIPATSSQGDLSISDVLTKLKLSAAASTSMAASSSSSTSTFSSSHFVDTSNPVRSPSPTPPTPTLIRRPPAAHVVYHPPTHELSLPPPPPSRSHPTDEQRLIEREEMTEEEMGAARLKYLIGLGPAPPGSASVGGGPTPREESSWTTTSTGSASPMLSFQPPNRQPPVAGSPITTTTTTRSSPIVRHATPDGVRLSKAAAAASSRDHHPLESAQRPRSSSSRPSSTTPQPAVRLKDSGYIPNNAANRPLADGVDKRAASSSLIAALAERNDVVCALGDEEDSEERREFVRGVLALIHTDKEFVDGLWRRYRETMGKHG